MEAPTLGADLKAGAKTRATALPVWLPLLLPAASSPAAAAGLCPATM